MQEMGQTKVMEQNRGDLDLGKTGLTEARLQPKLNQSTLLLKRDF